MRDPLTELMTFSEKLSISTDVLEEAKRVCRDGLQNCLFRRVPVARISAASLYAACREKDVLMPLKDVAEASGVGRKQLAACYRQLVNELDLKVQVSDLKKYVTMVAFRTRVSAAVRARALEIISKADEEGLVAGECPQGVAAAALYVAAALEGERLIQQDVAVAAGVREATVRRAYMRLRKVLNIENTLQPKSFGHKKYNIRGASTECSETGCLSNVARATVA